MPDFTFQINGQPVVYTEEQMWQALTSVARVESVTISTKERRDRDKYLSVEKFLSMQSNFTLAWNMIEQLTDWGQKQAARAMMYKAIQKDIMDKEAWLTQLTSFMFTKDNLLPYWRDPSNPYVKAGWDLSKAFQDAGVTVSSMEIRR